MDWVASGAIRGEIRPCRGFQRLHQKVVVDPGPEHPQREEKEKHSAVFPLDWRAPRWRPLLLRHLRHRLPDQWERLEASAVLQHPVHPVDAQQVCLDRHRRQDEEQLD